MTPTLTDQLFLISYRFAGLDYTLNALKRFSFSTKTQESFALQVKKVLFRHVRGFTEVATAHNIGQFFCCQHIMVSGISGPPHPVNTRIECTKCRSAKNLY